MQKNTFIEIIKSAPITSDFYSYEPEENNPDMLVYGVIWNMIELDGLEFYYEDHYKHPTGHPSQRLDIDVQTDERFEKLDIIVVDEDDNQLDEYEISELIIKHTNISKINWDILGTDEDNIEYIGAEIPIPSTGYEEITLVRTDEGDLRFIGKQLAHCSDDDSYSDTRWHEYSVYQLIDDSYVCYLANITLWQNERTVRKSHHVKELNNIKAFFGNSEIAQELYLKLDLE